MVTFLILAVVALLLSALFSGAEIAFISASKLGIELKRSEGSMRGRILARFFDEPEDFLSRMLVGNNIVLVIFTYAMTRLMEPWLASIIGPEFVELFLITLVVTAIILLAGEFLPKTFFSIFSNRILYNLALPLSFFSKMLAPPAWIMTKLSNVFLKYVLRSPIPKERAVFTRRDLEHFVQGSVQDTAEDLDKDIFKNALHLKQIRVRDCMVPRTEIKHIDVDADLEGILQLFQKTKHSRLLITENGDIDNVLGYVHHLQLLDKPKNIRKILMDVPIVPEVMSAQDLLLAFMKKGTNIACVVDEFGGVSGLITLEDILEEIFGEIEDEHDLEKFTEEHLGDNKYRFSGRLEINYLNEQYPEIEIPDGDYHTLSGYIVHTTRTIPEQGDEVILNDLKFTPELVSETKIEIVRVELLPSEE